MIIIITKHGVIALWHKSSLITIKKIINNFVGFQPFKGIVQVEDLIMGFLPYLLGNKGYPLISWIMTFLKKGQHFVLELLYNMKHKWGYSIVENGFGILKKTFQ